MLALLALTLTLATAAPPHEVTLVFPGFSGLDQNVAAAVSDRFASELGRGAGVRVVTRRDVEQVLGLERQRQLLGCSETSSSCIAELAAGLGAQALITGTVVPVGTKVTVTLRLIDARDGRVVSSESARLRDLDAAQDWLDEQAPLTRARALEVFGSPELKAQVSAAPPAGNLGWLPWLTAGVGGAAAVTGAILFGASKADADALRNVSVNSQLDVPGTRLSGQTKETVGVVLLAAGGAVLAGGIIWGVVRGAGPAKTTVGVAVVPDGAIIVFSGALP